MRFHLISIGIMGTLLSSSVWAKKVAPVDYQIQIELVQPGEPTKSLRLQKTGRQCGLEFEHRRKVVAPEKCQQIWNRYEPDLDLKKNLANLMISDLPHYRITVTKAQKEWVLNTDVTDHSTCSDLKKCHPVSGTKLRKLVLEMNQLL
jgi:hypothetical protein